MGSHAQTQEQLFALRQTIARIEGKSDHGARLSALAGGASVTDDAVSAEALPASSMERDFAHLLAEFSRPGLMLELRGERLQQAGAVSGLALAAAATRSGEAPQKGSAAGRILLIADPQVMRETGLLYGPGLADFGFRPGALFHAMPRRIEDALWLVESALASRAFSTVLFEVQGNPRKFGLTESRRLSLRARDTGRSLVIMRQAGEEEASSASLRLCVKPAPAVARRLADGSLLGGSIGHPAFSIRVEKSRAAELFDLTLEWNPHERRLRPLAPVDRARLRPSNPVGLFSEAVDRPHRPQALGAVMAFPGTPGTPGRAAPSDRDGSVERAS